MLRLIMPLCAVVVLLFLAARFVRSRDSLQAYQAKRQHHNETVLTSLHEAGKMLTPEEAMRPVVAGVRELVAAHACACLLADRGSSLRVETPALWFEVVWILRTTQLAAATVVGQGDSLRRGHWELRVSGEPAPEDAVPGHSRHVAEPKITDDLACLMTHIEALLCAQGGKGGKPF